MLHCLARHARLFTPVNRGRRGLHFKAATSYIYPEQPSTFNSKRQALTRLNLSQPRWSKFSNFSPPPSKDSPSNIFLALVWISSNRVSMSQNKDIRQHHHRAPCYWGTHNDIHTRNVVMCEGDPSPVVIDFGEANIREPRTSDEDRTTEIRTRVTRGGFWWILLTDAGRRR
ncbi:hypothetical protein ARMGADRAFT_120785 [Armillaria gallica]|uniref:Protein kinase domain-containing protein n=1 Tax=Armillaria gallica TaxID=47427 RepID=A0A2H3C8Y6_ARMGA|nr:hypothetical protein ARMGADRAFT_120785 [Armillaria gallica]